MIDKAHDPAFAGIARRVFPGARLLRHWRLTGGVSAVIDALEVEASIGDRHRAVVRRFDATAWKRQRHDLIRQEYQIMATLYQADFPVPEPLHLDTSCELLPTPYLVMRWVDGSTEISLADLPVCLPRMASFLARLHGLDPSTPGLLNLPQREDPVAGALACLLAEGEWGVLRERLVHYQTTEVRSTVLHGDYWPGNVLWAGGRIMAVIDWEDAALGPAASDLACARSELNAVYGEAATDAFTQSYLAASTAPIHDLALWDLYVSSAALRSMHQWGLPPDVEQLRRDRTTAFAQRAADKLRVMRQSSSSRRNG